jgi:hypothetical protein
MRWQVCAPGQWITPDYNLAGCPDWQQTQLMQPRHAEVNSIDRPVTQSGSTRVAAIADPGVRDM